MEFTGVLTTCRTQFQDAVPMALGQESTTCAVMIEEAHQRLTETAALMLESNLGGTAIGTGINGHQAGRPLRGLACAYLAGISGEPVRPAGDW